MQVVNFIGNYADERGLPQPAAPRGIDNIPTIYLTLGTTKYGIHKDYKSTCTESSVRAIQLTAFKDIWLTCLPHIRIASPRTDVCATCETLRSAVMDAVTEEEKLSASDAFGDHIHLAQQVSL